MPYILALTILLAPTYVFRFNLYGLPTNMLMVWLGLVWVFFVVWLIVTKRINAFFASVFGHDRRLLIAIGLFLLAGLVSLFVGGFTVPKLGQFIVWFIQPIGTYFIVRFVVAEKARTKDLLINAMYTVVGLAGVYAIAQYFTLVGLPSDWWGNSAEPKRAISFFAHPNAFALFITPVLAFLIPHILEAFQRIRHHKNSAFLVLAWGLGAVGLLLSLSRGGWLGLLAAAVLFVIISMNKRLMLAGLGLLIVLGLIVVAVPNLRYRVLLPFHGEKSSVARLSLWDTGTKMIKDSPLVGKGLLGFNTNWEKYNTDPGLNPYPAPHNIFLNFWIETGLLGLISFCVISFFAFVKGVKNRRNLFALGLALSIVAIFVHGQIDVPYLKNDLALLFWIMLAAFL